MIPLTVSATSSVLLLATVLVFFSLLALLIHSSRKKKDSSGAILPGPSPLPLVGNLHVIGKYPNPFVGFTALSKIYGDIYQLTLGTTRCVVVNSFPLIKEVLITKGAQFGGRPDFIRFHKLFGGDRNNSLALCDWSSLQKVRRGIARTYCTPRVNSSNYDELSRVACAETEFFLTILRERVGDGWKEIPDIKQLILHACANMFSSYMCSTRFSYDDDEFQKIVKNLDEIFWDINNGYAVDFMPWLLPFYNRYMNKISTWSKEVRQFICSRIVQQRHEEMKADPTPRDFKDALLVQLDKDPDMTWDTVLFELEDLLGGHCAVANLTMLVLVAVMKHSYVGDRIRKEFDEATQGVRSATLFDRPKMPYTEAAILETLRTSSSPIVPHVATEDTSVGGYAVSKDTVVFLNNYELNLSETYWTQPEEFRPERFIVDNVVVRPQHFIPFSTGKRTCMGQRLLQSCTFTLVANILGSYKISTDMDKVKLVPACVALPYQTFGISFTPRSRPISTSSQ